MAYEVTLSIPLRVFAGWAGPQARRPVNSWLSIPLRVFDTERATLSTATSPWIRFQFPYGYLHHRREGYLCRDLLLSIPLRVFDRDVDVVSFARSLNAFNSLTGICWGRAPSPRRRTRPSFNSLTGICGRTAGSSVCRVVGVRCRGKYP